ncbi:PREDICTED: uncharacterized protein LOC107355671 [Acropora digitifera]|uniref:uncharacterized protein LOC107355671 n=1 Tax=Acropora digitifera TaxID=70779 RepID=UPI00077AF5B2|nr:PREDICTED: uncharacterized protein LOC107355671 [Acropora digitifera]
MSQDTSAQVIEASSPHKEPLYITLLASEWNSLAGGLSTLNREFAIHLAQQTNVRVSLLVPEGACNDRDKREAQTFDLNVVEAKQRLGYEPLDWLGFPPEGHRMDVVVGHGVKLGRQVQAIKCAQQFQNCKWVQTVHTAPEDLGKYKGYENPTSRGEQKHWDEVGLCKCADLVLAVGPKLEKAYFSYLQGCKKREDIFGLTPGLFDREFGDIVQMPKTENDDFKVLLCGRGDNEDFELKGYNIAVKAFADPRLKGKSYHLVFVGAPDGMQDEVRKRLLDHGITEEQLTVRKFVQSRSGIKELLCEVDLAIMPSKSEGFGLVALEALSAGLPVLVGSNSGFASAIRDLPLGAYSIVDSVDPAKWAEAIKDVCVRHGVRLDENKILREHYGKKHVWKTQCKALVERLSGMISDDQGSSISQGLAADDSMGQQTVVIPEGTSGKELSKFGGTQGKQPATKTTRRHSVFRSQQSEFAMRSKTWVERTLSGIFYAVLTHNSVVVEYLRAEYNRRAQLRPLFWVNTMQLPLEKVYTRLKIVSRRTGGNQGETNVYDHEGELPSSRTNLYQVIVVCLLRRYCARHKVKATKEDMGLEKQFKRDICCLGELAWNCLLNDRHSFFEEKLEELENRNEKLVVRLFCDGGCIAEDSNLMRVLLFCRKFSEVEAPDEIHFKVPFIGFLEVLSTALNFASLPNLKSLDFSLCDTDLELGYELFQSLPEIAGLTELVLPDVPEIDDWEIVAEALTASKTLEKVTCTLLGERGDGWARALGAGLCAETPLSSISLRICGRMGETALQAFEKLLLNKSLFSVSVTVVGDMTDSLALTLARCLTGQTVVKSLELSVIGELSFSCANLIERGIVKNTSLSKLVVSLDGERPDNWQGIVENLNVQLAEKSSVTFEIYPNTFSPVTATQLAEVRPYVIEHGFFKRN